MGGGGKVLRRVFVMVVIATLLIVIEMVVLVDSRGNACGMFHNGKEQTAASIAVWECVEEELHAVFSPAEFQKRS